MRWPSVWPALFLAFASTAARADFGPDLGYLIALCLGFFVVLAVGVVLAPSGWRVAVAALVVTGFPLSMHVAGQVVSWLGTDVDYYERFRVVMWLTLVTWAYLPLALIWLRISLRRSRNPAVEPVAAFRAADWLVCLTVVGLFLVPFPSMPLPWLAALIRALAVALPTFGNWLPLFANAVVLIVPLLAAIGVWFRSRVAWLLAFVWSAIDLAASVTGLRQGAQAHGLPNLGGLPLAWLWNPEILGFACRLAMLAMLVVPLGRWVFVRGDVRPGGRR